MADTIVAINNMLVSGCSETMIVLGMLTTAASSRKVGEFASEAGSVSPSVRGEPF